MPNNIEFLTALFGEDMPWVHVTDFSYDPGAIPKERHLAAWKGDYFSRYTMGVNTNQYFTISNFYCDDEQNARRRKALFRHTPVIVLDDVKEKLSMVEVSKLPDPSWVLESSAGSEQWGYILDTPCTDRGRVENLLDGLVANGLAPDGRDPGMKGVTRYVRLPEGINNKASRLINGQPFKCNITVWNPSHKVTMEQLAAPFAVNLDAARREARVDGASDIPDHPLLTAECVSIKEIRSDGRFDITCPWVDEHTGADDSGSAVFTNDDGSIGFKCHHGACQTRTGKDLMHLIEKEQPGFNRSMSSWQALRSLAGVADVNFMGSAPAAVVPAAVSPQETVVEMDFMGVPAAPVEAVATPPAAPIEAVPADPVDGIDQLLDALNRQNPTSHEARHIAGEILKIVDSMNAMERKHRHDQICDTMHWSKSDFKDILKDLREEWYVSDSDSSDFYDSVIYIKEQNRFYDWKSRIFFTTDAFQNSYAHEDSEARKVALQSGRVQKVDKLDYAPKMPRVFSVGATVYGNAYYEGDAAEGMAGDVARWLDHWDTIGWGEHREHMLKWMAFTVKHPERKINHMMLLGSGEGCGKDFLLYPLIEAMGHNSETISGDDLLSDHNEYIMGCKHLHINEAELGDRREALAVSNKLKPLACAPPQTLRVNPKGVTAVSIRNIVNATMTTNSQMPLRLNGASRRFYAVWSDLQTRDEHDNLLPGWHEYWSDRWSWMQKEGAQACIWYLRNCVDLSDFNPEASPPMTEFLRDIREASKSPAQQTLEAFIQHRIGAFSSDIVTAVEMSQCLRAAELDLKASSYLFTNASFFTPVRIGQVMKELNVPIRMRGTRGQARTNVWVVRDVAKYSSMTGSEIYSEYEKQLKVSRNNVGLSAV